MKLAFLQVWTGGSEARWKWDDFTVHVNQFK